ncbi:MAG: hypothetical protein AB8D78_14970 [Akkermansiaceae bacterium]
MEFSKPLRIALVGILFITSLSAEVIGLRDWTNSKNQTLSGSLVRITTEKKDGKEVKMITLKLERGKEVSFEVDRLNAAHKKELLAWLKNNPMGVAPPSPPYFWPSDYSGSNSPKVEYVEFDAKRKAHLYHTAHFDFYVDVKISNSTVSKCVAVFDTIVEAIDALPMAMDTVPKGKRPRYQAILVSSRETYMKMGGIPNSGGFFSPSKNLTVIPFQSLGIVQKGNKWVFDGKRRSFETLLHELTHHATSHWYGMPPWFQEGLAEYMSVMPYQSGRFLFTNPQSAVVSAIRKYKDYVVGDFVLPKGEFQMVNTEQLFATDRRRWNGMMVNRAASARNYTSSMVLACYFMHEDGDGDGAHFIDWMHAWRAAFITKKTGEYDALIKKHLLRDRSFNELEEDIQEKMRKRGLRINFSS